jgi:hypothetical protein
MKILDDRKDNGKIVFEAVQADDDDVTEPELIYIKRDYTSTRMLAIRVHIQV